MDWPALRLAQRRDDAARCRFFIGPACVGSVKRAHLPALRAWPQWLHLHDDQVVLTTAASTNPAARASAALAQINTTLCEAGLVRGWRNEPVSVTDLHSGKPVARIERAAARFWGTLTRGAHATGYVADARGRPTHLWVAQRALNKATDPGLLDNLVGGGVPDGQTPWQALVREGWEEAGLSAPQMQAAVPGTVFRLQRDVVDGLQLEDIHTHDLRLPSGLQPVNQDGEVLRFSCVPVQQALEWACSDQMTVDASLVTLDFALRHRLCPVPEGAAAFFRQPL